MTKSLQDFEMIGEKVPLELKVQLLHKNHMVYQKTIPIKPKKTIFLSSDIRDLSIYLPETDLTSGPIAFIRRHSDQLQLHILPSWQGFYTSMGKISILNNQEEWVSILPQSFGSFHQDDFILSWHLQPVQEPLPERKPVAFRTQFIQTIEIQNLVVAAVIVLITCTTFSILGLRTKKPAGYMTSLSKSQQLLLLDQGHIYTAPEFIERLASGHIFNDIVRYFSKYNLLLANGEEESGFYSTTSHLGELAAIHKEMIEDVIESNNTKAQSKMIVPAIIGESQTTMLWRFLEKISFIQSSAKSFLQSRKKLNAELLAQAPYQYDTPEQPANLRPKTDSSLSQIYDEAQNLAAQSLRPSPDDEYFYANLRRQAASHQLPYMRSDFTLVHFKEPRSLSKLSKADEESQNPEAPQVH